MARPGRMDAPQAENSALREDGGAATRRHWEDLPFSRLGLGVRTERAELHLRTPRENDRGAPNVKCAGH